MTSTSGSSVALTLALLFSSYSILSAQVPYPSGVPSQLPGKTHEELTRVHKELVEHRTALRSKLAAHNAKCGKVETGSPLAAECQAEKADIEREIKLYAASVSAFNEAVSRAIALALSDPVKDGFLDGRLALLEQKFADGRDTSFAAEAGFMPTHPELSRLNGLLDRLSPLQNQSGEKLTLKVLKPSKHGYKLAAAARSTVYVMQEYLDQKPTDDELLFVLAHEMEHARYKHAAKTFVKAGGEKAFSFLVTKVIDPASVSELDASLEKMLTKRICEHSREHEKEADLSGAKLALAAGASPGGIKQFLDRLDILQKAATSGRDADAIKALREKASHPWPDERRSYLEEALKVRF